MKNFEKKEQVKIFLDPTIILLFIFIIIVFSIFSYSVWKSGNYEVISNLPKKYEIVGIKKPIFFQLDLKDVKTGNLYYKVSVSTNCNNWEKIPLNSKYTFNEIKYKFSKENIIYTKVKVDSNFCHNFN